MHKGYLTLLVLLVFTALLPPISVPASDMDCTAKVMASCTSCHYQTRICEKLGEKNRRAWKTTIKRMLRYGLVLDEAGQSSMLDCLVALEKDKSKLCK
jgi:hypothetical protein